MTRTNIPVSAPPDDRLGRLIDVVGQLAQQQRSLLESLRPPTPPSQPSIAPSPATQPYAVAPPVTGTTAPPAADLRSIVADLFRQQVSSAQQAVVRDGYLKQHLADLPEAYRRLMPDTADTAALATAEQTIRQQFRDDLKSVRRPDITSASGDPGRSPADVLDYGKLSPMQQIALGLKSAKPTAAGGVKPSDRTAVDSGEDAHATRDMLDDEPLFVGAD